MGADRLAGLTPSTDRDEVAHLLAGTSETRRYLSAHSLFPLHASADLPDGRKAVYNTFSAALVVLKASHASTVTEEHIRIHVHAFHEKGVISKYAVPQTVKIIEMIDKTSVGINKTLRQSLCDVKKCGRFFLEQFRVRDIKLRIFQGAHFVDATHGVSARNNGNLCLLHALPRCKLVAHCADRLAGFKVPKTIGLDPKGQDGKQQMPRQVRRRRPLENALPPGAQPLAP